VKESDSREEKTRIHVAAGGPKHGTFSPSWGGDCQHTLIFVGKNIVTRRDPLRRIKGGQTAKEGSAPEDRRSKKDLPRLIPSIISRES